MDFFGVEHVQDSGFGEHCGWLRGGGGEGRGVVGGILQYQYGDWSIVPIPICRWYTPSHSFPPPLLPPPHSFPPPTHSPEILFQQIKKNYYKAITAWALRVHTNYCVCVAKSFFFVLLCLSDILCVLKKKSFLWKCINFYAKQYEQKYPPSFIFFD